MKKRKKNEGIVRILGKYAFLFIGYLFLSILTGIIVMNFLTKPQEVVIPDLKGESIDNALVILGNLGLNVRISEKKYDRNIPPYHVISTNPESSSRVKKGRIVEVVLSKGTLKSFVPKLTGKNYLDAELSISQAQLNLGKIIRVHSENYAENITISSFPRSESEVASGSSVDLLVSSGPKEKRFIMPNLRGLPKKEAFSLIKAMGAEIGNIEKESNSIISTNHIISHNPSAGTLLKEGQEVDFLISTGSFKRIPAYTEKKKTIEKIKTYRTYSFTVPADGKSERKVLAKISDAEEEKEIYNRKVPAGKLINLFFETMEGTKLSIYLDGKLFFEKEY